MSSSRSLFDACGSSSDCKSSFESLGITDSNGAIAGIVVGSVVGLLLVFCLCYCCRKEKTLDQKHAEANAHRATIVGIKGSIKELRSSTAVKKMSNVERAMLKREIEEQLIVKKVEKARRTDGDITKKSFLESMSNSGRVYSSFASALIKSNKSVQFTDDIEKGAANEEEEAAPTSSTQDQAPLRQSNALARSLSIKLSKGGVSNEGNPNKCFLCLVEFNTGDEVCFSKNDNCKCGYHKPCIVNWLMKRKLCPYCREPFLDEEKGTEKEES